MRFLIALLPWLELLTLIQLGIETSALTALGWVLLTLCLGLMLLRRQGQGLFEELRRGGSPGPEVLLDEMALGFAGLLLMVPGLITDILALLVMFGPLRRRLLRLWQGGRAEPFPQSAEMRQSETLEGEFRRVDVPEIENTHKKQ